MSRRKRVGYHQKEEDRAVNIPFCNGKRSFKTKHDAEKIRLRVVSVFHLSEYQRIYKCPRCKKYHLTSQLPRNKIWNHGKTKD